MKKWVLLFLLPIFCFFISSCVTKTVTEYEYVKVPVEIKDVVEPAFLLRPDNSKLDIHKDVKTTFDIVYNSSQYLDAWMNWQTYAEALEEVIHEIEKTYGPESD